VSLDVASARIAVIGAGVAGLACARELRLHRALVDVFEQGRGPGGRVATQLNEFGPFDFGAQFFTVSHHHFEAVARRWIEHGIAQRWRGRVVAIAGGNASEKAIPAERYVGTPTMGNLGRQLAEGLEIHFETRVARIAAAGSRWQLFGDDGRELSVAGYDAVCLAVPAPQTVELLQGLSQIATLAASVESEPCWTALIALPKASAAGFDAAFLNDDPLLSWAACDSGKPQRLAVNGVAERWVLHAKPAWTRRFIDMEPKLAAHWLLRAFASRIGRPMMPMHLSGHLWRQATAVNPLGQPCLWDAKRRIGAAGDWCNGPRVESAYLSGLALAKAICG
jgi:hypothetical protein